MKLLDFGESQVLVRGSGGGTSGGVSSPEAALETESTDLEFQAPEMVSGGPVGTHTDMWAFGVLLYVLLR